jgi:hypothetical protein
MKWSISWVWVSVAVIGVLGIPRTVVAGESVSVQAGRITFTGAIAEPTCGVNIKRVATWGAAASVSSLSHPETCGGSGAAIAASQIYTVSVTHLSYAEPDRVLRYFSDYVRAGQANAPSPTLVTQTYE